MSHLGFSIALQRSTNGDDKKCIRSSTTPLIFMNAKTSESVCHPFSSAISYEIKYHMYVEFNNNVCEKHVVRLRNLPRFRMPIFAICDVRDVQSRPEAYGYLKCPRFYKKYFDDIPFFCITNLKRMVILNMYLKF